MTESKQNQQLGAIDLESIKLSPKSLDHSQPASPLMSYSPLRNFDRIFLIERVSQVIAPYFITVVGLLLYKENFLLGTILLVIGVIVLFKITFTKIAVFVESVKSVFQSNDQVNF